MKKTKDEVQKEADEVLQIHNDNGIVAMATGTGKSKVAINAIKRHSKDNLELRALIVVPTEKLRDENWKAEFHKWDEDFLWDTNVERSCYASINKLEGETFDLVILDEVHNITTNNSKFFAQNVVKKTIGLTATPPERADKVEILRSLKLKVIYTVTIDEAVEWGLISPFKITVIQTTLDTIKKAIPKSKTSPILMTEQAAYSNVTRMIDNINYGTATPQQLRFREMMVFKRLRLLYDLPSKTEAAKFLLEHIIPKEERTLIFAGSIAQAEQVCTDFFHSKTNDKKFNLFTEEKINRLSSVKSLNEGHNISNLDNALIIQLNSKELSMVQRIGRIVRYRDEHIANIYIINVRNTVDENWLESSLSDFDQNNITYLNYSQLKMNYL